MFVMEENKRNSNMSIIEGIGDEVIQFFACSFIILTIALVWFSTRVREISLCPSYVFIAYCLQRRLLDLRILMRMMARTNNGLTLERERQHGPSVERPQETSESDDIREHSNNTVGFSETKQNFEETALVQHIVIEQTHRDHDRILRTNKQGTNSRNKNSLIKINLKFPNDSAKTAEGNLLEKLGEFKIRTFTTEFSQGKKVLMIFNGRLLDNDEETIAACGLFDNCVVHCLIRTPPYSARPPRLPGRLVDVFPMLLLSWALVLGALWYSRWVYAQLFSASATFGLMFLTILFVGSVVAIFLPDEESGLVPRGVSLNL